MPTFDTPEPISVERGAGGRRPPDRGDRPDRHRRRRAPARPEKKDDVDRRRADARGVRERPPHGRAVPRAGGSGCRVGARESIDVVDRPPDRIPRPRGRRRRDAAVERPARRVPLQDRRRRRLARRGGSLDLKTGFGDVTDRTGRRQRGDHDGLGRRADRTDRRGRRRQELERRHVDRRGRGRGARAARRTATISIDVAREGRRGEVRERRRSARGGRARRAPSRRPPPAASRSASATASPPGSTSTRSSATCGTTSRPPEHPGPGEDTVEVHAQHVLRRHHGPSLHERRPERGGGSVVTADHLDAPA